MINHNCIILPSYFTLCHFVGLVENGQFHYLSGEAQDHKRLIQMCPYSNNFSDKAFTWSDRTHSYIEVFMNTCT